MEQLTTKASEPPVFERIVCGVDGTPPSLTAVKQALRLQDAEGSLLLLAVANLAQAVHAGMAASHAAGLLQHDAEAALAEAKAIAHGASSKLVDGDPVAVLLNQAEAERASRTSFQGDVAHAACGNSFTCRRCEEGKLVPAMA